MRRMLQAATLVGVAAWCAARAEPVAQDPPLDVGLEEQVEVRLVLVDFVALDRDDRTVADLEAAELTLLVDGRETPIRSLDRRCPLGAAEEPRAGSTHEDADLAGAEPRRIVLVLDYYHMESAAETYDRLLDGLERWAVPGDWHMIVALGDAVRIEAPWTQDLDEVRRTLGRMRQDVTLYGGNHSRLTEWPFFDRIEILLDVLEREPGRKTIVLLSGPFAPDGFDHDPAYRRLSAMSTIARTAIYPVDTGGLRSPIDPRATRLGGPGKLRRLANETGGRMTADTNDIALAYARAQRDLSCSYTLAFEDTRPRLDDRRRLTLYVDRRGVRIVYPEFYVVRSGDEKRRSLEHTAALVPEMFSNERVTARLFVLGPKSSRRWNVVLAVRADVEAEEPSAGAEWFVQGHVRKPNGTIVRSFERRVPAATDDNRLTLFEDLSLAPGSYRVSAVVSTASLTEPLAAVQEVELAEVPEDTAFLVGPLLGRIHGEDFEPLLDARAFRGDVVESRTLLCVSGSAASDTALGTVARELLGAGGGAAQTYAPAMASFAGTAGNVRCHETVDRLETEALVAGGYELVASAHDGADRLLGRGSATFTVLAPAP